MQNLFTLPRKYLAFTVASVWGYVAANLFFSNINFVSGFSLRFWLITAAFSAITGLCIGSLTILTIDLVFGTRKFWERMTEGVAWIVVTMAGAIGMLSFGDRFITEGDHVTPFLLAPAVWMVFQFPLWAVAYGTQWQLHRDQDPSVPRAAWSLRDWMVGCVVFSVSLATAKGFGSPSAIGGFPWGLMLLYVSVNIVLIVMPATLYVLRPVEWRRVVWGVVIHLLCFTIPTVLQVIFMG